MRRIIPFAAALLIAGSAPLWSVPPFIYLNNTSVPAGSGGVIISGATSGSVTVKAAAIAGSNTVTLPAGTTDLSATGGTSQVLKQTSTGAALTVARLVCADLSDAGAGCSSAAVAPLTGTTGSIGGGALLAGACTSGTVSVATSTTAMVAIASPVTYPGDGFDWVAYVSSAGTVTVKVCGFIAGTPGATNYNVRVLQ